MKRNKAGSQGGAKAFFESMLRGCALCPRACGANRVGGEKGWCGAGNAPEVFAYFPHYGEEPPVSGTGGSGTVFFSRCTLSCLYCQNHRWSQDGAGSVLGSGNLALMLAKLREASCHNWNMVSPTPWLPWIVDALDAAALSGPMLPVVFNSSGFERVETLRALEGVVDVYLVDLRYSRNGSALEASGSACYVESARAAVAEMWRQVGPLKVDDDGIAVSGVICRMLVLPGLAGEAIENLAWLAGSLGTGVSLSIMSQYTPAHRAAGLEPWNRRVTRAEYEGVCSEAERLGFGDGWIQEYDGDSGGDLAGFNMQSNV